MEITLTAAPWMCARTVRIDLLHMCDHENTCNQTPLQSIHSPAFGNHRGLLEEAIINISIANSVSLSVCLFVCLSLCLSRCLTSSLSRRLSVCFSHSFSLFFYVSLCLSLSCCLSRCLYVSLTFSPTHTNALNPAPDVIVFAIIVLRARTYT